MISLHSLRRTVPVVGPVRLLMLLVLLAAPAAVESAVRRPRVLDSILGIRIGSTVEEANARLDPLAFRKGDEAEEEEEREEGRTKAWMLKSTVYRSVALKVNDADRVVWITGFVRPGREIPFSKLGDLSIARATKSTAIWNVRTREGAYRLVARGRGRRATVISLLLLDAAPGD